MINLARFCPFERIAAFFIKKGIDAGCSTLSITFEGYGTRHVNLKDPAMKGLDTNFKEPFTVEQRYAALASPGFDGVASLQKGSQLVKAEFHVLNILSTKATPRTDLRVHGKVIHKNGLLGDSDNCYSAPLTTYLSPDKFIVDEPVATAGEFTPFYQYIYNTVKTDKGTVVTFLGPKPTQVKFKVGTVKTHLFDEEVFVDEADLEKLGLYRPKEGPVAKPATRGQDDAVMVYMTYNGANYPLIMSQTTFSIGNVPLSFPVYFNLLKLQVYLETLVYQNYDIPNGVRREGNTFYVRMERHGNDLYPAYEEDCFIREHVLTSDSVLTCFDGISCYDRGIFIRSGSDEIFITSSSRTAACFAWSLSYLLAAAGDNTFASMVMILKQLVQKGYLVPVYLNDKNGIKVLEGRSTALFDGTVKTFDCLKGTLSFALQRSCLPALPSNVRSGLILIGCDLRAEDANIGNPDHYIVGYVDTNGRVSAVYDPYRSGEFIKAGVDITHFNNRRDTLFYVLDGNIQFNGEDVLLALKE